MLTGERKMISKTVINIHIRWIKERNNGAFLEDAPLFNFRIRIFRIEHIFREIEQEDIAGRGFGVYNRRAGYQ